MADENEDLRAYKRIPLTTRLRFRKMDVPSETEHVIDKAVTNISGGGLYVPSTVACEKGTLLQMEFRIPSRKDKVVVLGRVVWVREDGMGVEFLKIDPKVKAEIVKNARRGAWVDSSPELPPVKVTPVEGEAEAQPDASAPPGDAPPEGEAPAPPKDAPAGEDPFKM